MAEYDVAFARKLAEVAESVVERGLDSHEARRTVVYLSRLSIEISLKAFLERAGRSVADIKRHWHDLRKLIADVGECEVEIEITFGTRKWCSASRLRAITVSHLEIKVPIGTIIDAEDCGASTFPNEIRYGEDFRDFPPELLALTATEIAAWVHSHWDVIRLGR